ncbi:uncharacterized protein LOC106065420 [Biomphalaria glabrata]|uniref:Uncharacterized protein LOC106065420 n=1 Tax=Biomphalaria glabrata TaxID=6526 RepID=A0A9W3AYJ7_BIOGL|nr:uncharacterized protein LOC106065420 [Biomphalaria glabrata]XP_055892295.1 uncharacterized protein LOC106065420 [Biomphalaria glabrata]
MKMLFDSPTQKFGYLDIKQSSKVKGRKLKTWRRRWLVLTKMTNMSNDEFVAKLDLYTSESSWKSLDNEKTTFMLENISCIQSAKSKTHPNAFEIVEKQPILVLSGATDLESYSWMLTLQQMLTPEQIETKKDSYIVKVFDNEYSQKWNLSGQMTMNVSPACISLVDTQSCIISWALSTLIRFNVEKNPITGLTDVLMIECGPHSPTGQSCFKFSSDEAQEILSAIRQSICLALAQKQIARKSSNTRPRTVSVTVSEKGFQHLLDTIPVVIDPSRDRSESDSSNSLTGTSPTLSVSPSAIKQEIYSSSIGRQSSSRVNAEQGVTVGRTSSELEALVESDEQLTTDLADQLEVHKNEDNTAASQTPSKDTGYSVIKAVPSLAQVNSSVLFSAHSEKNLQIASKNLNSENSHHLSEDINLTSRKSDEQAHYESTTSDLKLNSTASIRTMTLPLMKDDKRSVPHYQEIKTKDSSTPKEDTPKKRSSSTGDLQVNLKHSESDFENDYEELDELRASVQRLKLSKQSDSPPALPARPSAKNFVHNKLNSSARMNTKKKRPFFKRSEKSVRHSDEDVSQKSDIKMCMCSDIGAERLPFVSDSGFCVVCQGIVEFQKPKKRVPSKENVLGSTHSSLNDLYSSIPEVSTNLTKRRRSSDITPVSSSFYAACDISLTDIKKQTSQNCSATAVTDSGSQDDDGACASKIVPKPLQYNASDPLISFFVDDENFLSHPMVSGIKESPPTPPTTPTLSPNFDLTFQQMLLDSPTSHLPSLPFIHGRESMPPSSSSFPIASPQTQFPFVFLPFPFSPLSPTPGMLPDAMLWNQSTFGSRSPEYTPEDTSYISMEGRNFQNLEEKGLRNEDTSGVYVGPSHRSSGDIF